MKKYLIAFVIGFSTFVSLRADVVVDGSTVIRTLPDNVGGVMLQPYADTGSSTHGFTNTPAYQNAFAQAGPLIARLTTFPDYHKTADANPTSITTNYDPKIDLILANGATPLFLFYTAPNNTTANSNILVADYVDTAGKNQATNGVTDATLATNVVYLVNHYLGLDGGHYASNPINMQYWEIGNEPDDSVNGNYWGGTTITYKTYCAQFDSVDAALRAVSDGHGGTLRQHVMLCGPAMSHAYSSLTNGANGDYTFYKYFLTNCAATGACDIVTRHVYSGTATTNAGCLNNGSNGWYDFDASYDAATNSTDRIGEAGIQQDMATLGVPTTVGTGITELNTSTQFHSVLQGVWTALMHHYAIYNYHQLCGTAPGGTILTTPIQLNYQSLLTNGFIFDTFGTNLSGFGYFNTDPTGSTTPWTQGDYNYWACYIMNKMTGGTVLKQSYTTALGAGLPTPLVCTATEDSQYLYVQVINRSYDSTGNTPLAVTDTVDLTHFPYLGTGSVYTLSGTVNNLPLNGGTPGTQTAGINPSFSYNFPALSVTVFKFPITVPTNGLAAYYRFEQDATDSSGNGNNGTARTGFTYSTDAKEGSYSGVCDGNGGRVNVPDSTSLEITGNLTVACWVKTSVFSTDPNLIAKSFNSGYRFRLMTTGAPNLILGNGTPSPIQKTSTQTVPSGVWAHVAATVTFSGGTATFKFYVNGVPDTTSQTAALSSIQAGTGTLDLGCAYDADNQPLNGQIDEAVIYNRALSDAEIAALAGN